MTATEPITNFLRIAGSKLTEVARAKDLTPILTTVTDAVLEAVQGIPEESLRRVAPHDAGIAYQPRALLALLTFSSAFREQPLVSRLYHDISVNIARHAVPRQRRSRPIDCEM